MNRWTVFLLSFVFLVGCLDVEEELLIREDGSVLVRMEVEGDAVDVLDGYPIPLHGPWVPEDEVSRQFVQGPTPTEGRQRVAVAAQFESVLSATSACCISTKAVCASVSIT